MKVAPVKIERVSGVPQMEFELFGIRVFGVIKSKSKAGRDGFSGCIAQNGMVKKICVHCHFTKLAAATCAENTL